MLSILRLPQTALRLLLGIASDIGLTERRLRPILNLPTEEAQVAALERMRRRP